MTNKIKQNAGIGRDGLNSTFINRTERLLNILFLLCSLMCNYGVALAVFLHPVTSKDTCIFILSLFLNCYYFVYLEVLNK